MKITIEKLTPELSHEVLPLLRQHTADVYAQWGLPKPELAVDPSWAHFLAMEADGKFFCVTVRDEGKLVGYSAFTVMKHPHIHITYAYVDLLFMAPEYRGGIAAKALLDYTSKVALTKGAEFVYLSVPQKLANKLSENGWKQVEVGCVYTENSA